MVKLVLGRLAQLLPSASCHATRLAAGRRLLATSFSAGSRVSMNAAVIHYDESIFGEDSARFKPNRWIQGDVAVMDRHMLHFGGGSRTCIGKHACLINL